MKTRDEIFAKSDKLFPDFGSIEHHGKSLGFEEGATWISALDDVPTRADVVAEAERRYEIDPDDEASVIVSTWRRNGFVLGASWAVDGMLDWLSPI